MVFQLSLYIKRSIPNLYFTKINFLFLTYTKINLVVKEKKKKKKNAREFIITISWARLSEK